MKELLLKIHNRRKISNAKLEEEIAEIKKQNINIIETNNKYFPENLKSIPQSPKAFYALGNLELLNRPKIAIIGSRNPSFNNLELAGKLASFLNERDITVISGFARGIDSQAHKNSINNTIAVLGSGLNKIYPPENKILFESLKENSLIISEYPIDTPPLKQNFPKRNRIISALADIVVIVEAREKSGSLITARLALEYNKEIFAVPAHPFDYRSQGSNRLIRDGANILLEFQDLIECLDRLKLNYKNLTPNHKVLPNGLDIKSDKERQILELLSDAAISIEEIANKLNIDDSELLKIISELELKELIYRDFGDRVCRRFVVR